MIVPEFYRLRQALPAQKKLEAKKNPQPKLRVFCYLIQLDIKLTVFLNKI